jgi:threonine/homoserine/homoserine lactone efflux protein
VREWLVPALGLALSPLPVLAMLLILAGRRATRMGSWFWLAWLLGVAVPTVTFVVLAESAAAFEEDSRAIAAAEIAVGILLLLFAARLLAARRRERRDGVPPWLRALDRAGAARVAGIAIVLSALNPKNLALMLAAAVSLAQTSNRYSELSVATLGFVLVAISPVTVLLLGSILRSGRFDRTLVRLRAAVARRDRAIAIVLGVLIGAYFVVDGVRAL